MLKVLLPILVIMIIGLIIGIIFFIKDVKKNYDSDNTGANLLSLFFPIVGFIIYAVNIGKNNKIAKSCIRMALLGMMCGVTIFLMCRCTLMLIEGVHTEHKGTRITNKVENKSNKELKSLKEELLNKEYLNNCTIETKGKIVTINIDYTENNIYDTKLAIGNIINSYDLDTQYDYSININSKYYGFYKGVKGSQIIWNENNGDE